MLIDSGMRRKSGSKTKHVIPLSNKRQAIVNTYSNIMQKKFMKMEHRVSFT